MRGSNNGIDPPISTLTPCCKCNGKFVTHTFELTKNYVCGLCEPPARAGKGKGTFKRDEEEVAI